MRRRDVLAVLAASGAGSGLRAQASDEVAVYAAGSLRSALGEIGRRFEAAPGGARVRFVFGASGLLKDRLLAGERADVFASANMTHPQALFAAGRARAPQRFARNRLCVLARPEVAITTVDLAERLLDPTLRVGTSTPKADPSGDYAFEMFRRIEVRGAAFAGAYQRLADKALQLTGGPASPPPPAGRSVYGALLESRQADVFVTYCSNAHEAAREVEGLKVVELPGDIDVAADYGVSLLDGASPAAQAFTAFLLGDEAQGLLARQGFAPR
ncbi:molybdate ABC transporter substrate-binding protein [Caldimonas sp. KR1-144]|uniref:molybdate ABC transporter substrate-binding protein n=1 Tax=Caldimonas sp. KR1-144 TaxID=3400911 RepID=UPI003C0BDA3B